MAARVAAAKAIGAECSESAWNPRGNLVGDDFDWITGQLMDIAGKYAGNRVVSVLEGGYALSALGRSVVAHLKVLGGL